MIIVLCGILIFGIYFGVVVYLYNKTTYKAITHNSYISMRTDSGKYGEYNIYINLRHFESHGYKFLFNVYLPKNDKQTTELDALLIGPEGVFVFESKNYSGWIFGNDRQKNWTQVLPTGRGNGKSQKEHFYNPVWQNRTHCAVLKNYLPQNTVIQSIVLFSDKCTLKDVTINSSDVIVANLYDVGGIVRDIIQNSDNHSLNVEEVYQKLYPFSQVSDDVKQSHIEDLNSLKTDD